LSKLSQLKQEAYQAGKKRDWEKAIGAYEQILELDKNNPTVINELGDLCLKAGETARGVRHFLSAAAKYRQTGLLNNGVAIYKKILRHDDENLNAHWYLAETRASQGLHQEGETHAMLFLQNSENVVGDIKEIFLKRCCQLFELYPQSHEVLEALLQVFRMWDLQLEAARTRTLLACLLFDGDKADEAQESMDEVERQSPEITNYPEYGQWQKRINPGAAPVKTYNDFDSVALDAPVPAAVTVDVDPAPEAPAAADPTPAFGETDFSGLSADIASPDQDSAPAETDFSGLAPAKADPADGPEIEIPVDEDTDIPFTNLPTVAAEEETLEKDDDGCFSLDDTSGGNFDDLISQAESAVAIPAADGPGTEVPAESAKDAQVDLLAEILADSEDDDRADASNQLAAITREIGEQVGGSDEDTDPSSQYEMGLVYLEMGLTDQACTSFQMASGDTEFATRSFEMWGITLLRGNRPEEAMVILGKGLDTTADGSREQLGMKYHLAEAMEKAGQTGEAATVLEEIQAVDPKFLDVEKRLAKLQPAG